MSGTLDQGSFISPEKSVGSSFIECLLQHSVVKTLWRLRHDHALARQGCGNQSAFCGTFHLLDRVHGGHSGNGCAVFPGSFDYIVNDFRSDKRADGIVDENNVV